MLAGMTLLVAAIVAATVAAAVTLVGRAERRELAANLERSQRVFEDFLGFRQSVLRSDCRQIANEPMLRATVGTPDVNHETILGVVDDLRASLGSDLFLLTDGEGRLLADALDRDAEGYDMKETAAVAQALAGGDAAAVWITGDRPHQVHACRIAFGEQVVGIVVLGEKLDDAAAGVVERQTGSVLVIGLDGKRVASSRFPDLEQVPAAADGEVTVAGTRYAVVGGKLPGYAGSRTLTYALLRSLDEALAPGRQLTRTIFVIAAVALFAAIVIAGLLARRLARPVDALVQFTHEVGDGKLAVRAKPSGPTELRTLAAALNRMVEELARSREQVGAKERLEREMEIAQRIQTSILPRSFDVRGLEIAARMLPASEVGGDYYDILPVENGCWIGIGDVAGHGVTAGLEMLMVQSIVAALVNEKPGAMPSQLVTVLNAVMFENVRNRLGQDEYVTLTLLRHRDGTLTFAGAHEDIVLLRKKEEACTTVRTPGTWIGGMREITPFTNNSRIELEAGDLVVLYSDGVTEAKNAQREMFGVERLCRVIEATRDRPVETIRDAIVDAVTVWQLAQDDDITVVVMRRDPSRLA